MDGRRGSSYIDSVILRDRDTTGASPHALDERVYYLQNWRADVVTLITDDRHILEHVRYSPYGTPFCLPGGDLAVTPGAGAPGVTSFSDKSDADGELLRHPRGLGPGW